MLSTPICDFAEKYARSDAVRMHMPGHKGKPFLGCEALDLTEIEGADDLYHANGIIAESEQNASALFGCHTLYSTEGSSLCIRAMLFLAMGQEERPLILAGRNAHKAFLNAAVVLDFEIEWLYPSDFHSYHSCVLTPEDLEHAIITAARKPRAVYLTSPDYLGTIADIPALAAVCQKYGILLLVDNAHGAYLRFLSPSLHPMDLGADLCCDSAHKTLPVLTGGAYLHIKDSELSLRGKEALALFGSTSPSYLILQALDRGNPYMEELPEELTVFLPKVEALRTALCEKGYPLWGSEPLKITIAPKACGYTGSELGEILRTQNMICEFCDPDFLVLMFTPENTEEDLRRLEEVLCSLPFRAPLTDHPPRPEKAAVRMTPREAVFSPRENCPIDRCKGRILAAANVACPPAIPIIMCGEEISDNAVALFRYYGIQNCAVIK